MCLPEFSGVWAYIPITVRAFFNRSHDRNDDNLWLGAFQQPPERIKKGTMGRIDYTVTASTGPLPARDFEPADTGHCDHNRGPVRADRKR